MQRRVLIAVGVFAFLAISFVLARVLVGAGNERSAVLTLLRAEARGDASAVLRQMPSCERDPTCARVTRARTARLRRAGRVQILNYQPSAQATFVGTTGSGRVAWRTEQRRYPVVQCVVVRRAGPLTGGGVEILSISNPIGLEARCG